MEKIAVGIMLFTIIGYAIFAFIVTYTDMNKDIRWYK